jgi:hypothetical protein
VIIRRVGIWSAAKLYGAMLAAMGLVFGAIFALASLAGGAFAPDGSSSGPLAMMFGAGAIILLPIFYGILGVVMGAISAGLYNLFAGMIGGLEVETEP